MNIRFDKNTVSVPKSIIDKHLFGVTVICKAKKNKILNDDSFITIAPVCDDAEYLLDVYNHDGKQYVDFLDVSFEDG